MPYNHDARTGATVLLTRPRAASERFAAEIAERGLPAAVVIAPLMEIVPLAATAEAAGADGVIFTSANAIGLAGPGRGRPAWCVGARTADVARAAGYDAICAGGCADALVARMTELRPSGRIVHLHGRHQRGDVAGRLTAAGLEVVSCPIYDQKALRPSRTFFDALDLSPLVVPLFSPRSAALFVEAAGERWHPGARGLCVALSEAVRQAVPTSWRDDTIVAERADAAAMLDGIATRLYP